MRRLGKAGSIVFTEDNSPLSLEEWKRIEELITFQPSKYHKYPGEEGRRIFYTTQYGRQRRISGHIKEQRELERIILSPKMSGLFSQAFGLKDPQLYELSSCAYVSGGYIAPHQDEPWLQGQFALFPRVTVPQGFRGGSFSFYHKQGEEDIEEKRILPNSRSLALFTPGKWHSVEEVRQTRKDHYRYSVIGVLADNAA